MKFDKYFQPFNANLDGDGDKIDPNTVGNFLQKALPAEFLYSDIQFGFEVSEGRRPAEPFVADRYAPIVRQIRTKGRDWKQIVIPRGTIIGGVPVFNKETYVSQGALFNMGGASGDVGSGEIALGIGYDTNVNTVSIDDMHQGYDILRILGTIANGGSLVKDAYTDFDTDLARVGADGALVTDSDTYTRLANAPIGFVTEDVYLYDDGQKLNYTNAEGDKFRSFHTDYYVEMPYFAGNKTTYKMNCSVDGSGVLTMGDAYATVRKLGVPFFTASSLANLIPGKYVSPDLNGKYTLQYDATTVADAATIQTVGKLISVTNKFPRDFEDHVEVYSAKHGVSREILGTGVSMAVSKTGGTATYGIAYSLWTFAVAILAANGTTINYANIRDLINSGVVGIARVNLNVS